MPRSITCLLFSKEITVDEALDIRASKSSDVKRQITHMVCVECGKPVRPHKEGRNSGAHFEHSERNPACKLSDTKRLEKSKSTALTSSGVA